MGPVNMLRRGQEGLGTLEEGSQMKDRDLRSCPVFYRYTFDSLLFRLGGTL